MRRDWGRVCVTLAGLKSEFLTSARPPDFQVQQLCSRLQWDRTLTELEVRREGTMTPFLAPTLTLTPILGICFFLSFFVSWCCCCCGWWCWCCWRRSWRGVNSFGSSSHMTPCQSLRVGLSCLLLDPLSDNLEVADGALTEEELHQLVKALRENTSLNRLWFTGIAIPDPTVHELSNIISGSSSLVCFGGVFLRVRAPLYASPSGSVHLF